MYILHCFGAAEAEPDCMNKQGLTHNSPFGAFDCSKTYLFLFTYTQPFKYILEKEAIPVPFCSKYIFFFKHSNSKVSCERPPCSTQCTLLSPFKYILEHVL